MLFQKRLFYNLRPTALIVPACLKIEIEPASYGAFHRYGGYTPSRINPDTPIAFSPLRPCGLQLPRSCPSHAAPRPRHSRSTHSMRCLTRRLHPPPRPALRSVQSLSVSVN